MHQFAYAFKKVWNVPKYINSVLADKLLQLRHGSDWFERRFDGLTDGLVCEYVRIKLVDRLKDNPVPFTRREGGGLAGLTIRLAQIEIDHYEGRVAADELVQINVRKVTCFKDGERRRFVAHFDAVRLSL